MSDTELLELIGHYKWTITAFENSWIIKGKFGSVSGENWREVLMNAYDAQVKWALSLR